MTFETYALVSSCWGLNEFVFCGGFDCPPDSKQLYRLAQECNERIKAAQRVHAKYADPRTLASLFLQLREEIVPAYLAECAQAVIRNQPTMVGFTCMFDQTLASVALARVIKEISPNTLIALGGYALEGQPGIQVMKAFPWIDCIGRGDGEPIVSEIARASVGLTNLREIPGVMARGEVRPPGLPPVRIPLDSSPAPDYDDWFSDVAYLRESAEVEIRGSVLPVESSRGCWYGQAKHCIFCGIDDETLKYRSKSPRVVLDMLESLRAKYGNYNFRFNDYILPSAYYSTLLVDLAKVQPRFRLQCEIKSNQSPARLKLFREAGFTDLQPGIESFSSAVLRIMDKGVRGIQNVFTLKTGFVNGLVIHYNILYGLPGERPEYYLEMLKAMPTLYHLQPPVSRAQTEITRGAPLQTAPFRFGICKLPRHAVLYDVLFSDHFLARSDFSLDGYAYYFERDFEWSDELAELYLQLVIQVNNWKARHRQENVILGYRLEDGCITFYDSRFGDARSLSFGEIDAAVYVASDAQPLAVAGIADKLGCTTREVEMALDRLDQERLIWREANEVFGLGVDMSVVEAHIASGWKKHWTSLYC